MVWEEKEEFGVFFIKTAELLLLYPSVFSPTLVAPIPKIPIVWDIVQGEGVLPSVLSLLLLVQGMQSTQSSSKPGLGSCWAERGRRVAAASNSAMNFFLIILSVIMLVTLLDVCRAFFCNMLGKVKLFSKICNRLFKKTHNSPQFPPFLPPILGNLGMYDEELPRVRDWALCIGGKGRSRRKRL